MAYDWTQLTEKEITNLYLYGTPTTPTDLINDARIRPAGAVTLIDVNRGAVDNDTLLVGMGNDVCRSDVNRTPDDGGDILNAGRDNEWRIAA